MARKPNKATAMQAKVMDFASIGTPGINSSGGYISEEFLPELSGANGVKVYRQMADNDPIVGAILFVITMLIRGADWPVQAAGESPEEEDAKIFLESILDDMQVSRSAMISEICSMFTYGFAPMELLWKRRAGHTGDAKTNSVYDDGLIGLRGLSLRAQRTVQRWDIDPDDGTIHGFWQQAPTRGEIYIPAERMALFRVSEDGNNPQGRSLLRTAYRSWHFKTRIEEIEGVGIERDLAGLPMAMIPSNYFAGDADPDEKMVLAAWQKLLTQVRRDQQEGILMPSDRDDKGNLLFEFKLLNAGGARTFDTTKIIDRYDRRIATSVLADFLFLGQQAVGSFALSSDKTALFAAAIGGFAKHIVEILNREVVERLWRYNAMDPAIMPWFVAGDLETPNLAEIAAYITALAGAGAPMFPDRDLENHLREIAGLPLSPDESEADAMDTPDPETAQSDAGAVDDDSVNNNQQGDE